MNQEADLAIDNSENKQQIDDIIQKDNQKQNIDETDNDFNNQQKSPEKQVFKQAKISDYFSGKQNIQITFFSEKKQAKPQSLDQLLFDQSVQKIKQSQTNYKNIISKLSNELSGFKNDAQKELHISRKKIKELNEQIYTSSEQKQNYIIELKQQVDILSQELEYQKTKNEELTQQKQKFIQIIDDLQMQKNSQQDEKKKLDLQLFQLKSNSEIKIQKLESQLGQANQKIQTLEVDKRDLQQKFLNASRGITESVVQDLENQFQKIDVENSLLKNEIFDLKFGLSEKNRKIEQLEKEIASKQNHTETFRKKIEELNLKIQDYQKESIQKDQQILNIINQNQKTGQIKDQLNEKLVYMTQKIIDQEQEIKSLRKLMVEKAINSN